MNGMSAKDMIAKMEGMDNGERIDFLEYLYEKHFKIRDFSEDEIAVLRAYHDGAFEGIELDEWKY